MNQKKTIKWITLAFVVANLGLVMYVVLGGAASSKPVHVPNPNGVYDFVKAGALVSGNPSNYKSMDHAQLSALIASNSETLKLLQSGIAKECLITNELSQAYFANVVTPRLSQFKQCAQLLNAAGRLAELEGRTNDALHHYLNGVQFGEKCAHGGVFIEKLVGVAIGNISCASLETLRTNLDAAQCAETARVLEKVDAEAETAEQVIANEKDYADRIDGLRGRFFQLVTPKQLRDVRNRMILKINGYEGYRRRLMLSFAARAYELDKGKPAANAAALVPEYLKKVPPDPDTGKEMELR